MTGRARQCLGTEKRQHAVGELHAELGLLLLGQLRPVHDLHANSPIRAVPQQRVEHPVLPGNQGMQPDGDGVEDFLRAELVRGWPAALQRGKLLQRTDLRRDEVVQIGGEDAEEANPCGGRDARVFRQGEHACVELDPRELGIEELLRCGARRIQLVGRQHGCAHLAQSDAARARDLLGRHVVFGRGAERRAGPFRNQWRACRDGECGQSRGVPQHRRSDALEQLGRGEPLQRRIAPNPTRRPHLQRGAVTGRRHHAQQSQQTLTAPDDPSQRGPAICFATPPVDGHAELGAEAAQSQTTMLDRDQGQLALAPQLTRE